MLRRVLELAVKAPHVLWFRGHQAVRQHWWRRFGCWPRLANRIQNYWTDERAGEWLATQRTKPAIFPPGAPDRLAEWQRKCPASAAAVRAHAQAIVAGSVPLFGQAHSIDWTNPPWHADWRIPHEWPRHFHADYHFYANADVPLGAEIKFPWELSRLGFLQPVALAASLEPGGHAPAWVAARVSDWSRANPCATSVNWYPMECSMRGVNLALVLALLAAAPRTTAADVAPLLRALALQAEFVARNTEYTRHRENHFAANVACLGLAGLLLDGHQGAASWQRAARRWLPREIEGQFLADGMNFEKSTAYHRLTLELFLLLALAEERAGHPLPATARQRLHAAVTAMSHCRHPDGAAPLFGDNDSARALAATPEPPSQRGSALAAAAALFPSGGFRSPDVENSPWTALFASAVDNAVTAKSESRHWGTAAGGFFTAATAANALLADFGEVGFHGQGGHGHNDLFSFELSLGGRRIVVDSGCPVYTSNRRQYDEYRGTAAHNGLMVDGQEIAPLLGWWRIADVARPREVRANWQSGRLHLTGCHDGYARLPDPVSHCRELSFDAPRGTLEITDLLKCRGAHDTVRYLHFAPGLEVVLGEHAARVVSGGEVLALLEWDRHSRPAVQTYHQSPEFGTLLAAQCLQLAARVGGGISLTLRLSQP